MPMIFAFFVRCDTWLLLKMGELSVVKVGLWKEE
jgi:hypothetical protein